MIWNQSRDIICKCLWKQSGVFPLSIFFHLILLVGDKFQKEMAAALVDKETQFQNQVFVQ